MLPLRHPSPAPWRAPDHVVVETCVETIDGVRVSAQAGADRAELCDNVAVGGTTPSIGVVEAAIIAAAEVKAERRARAGEPAPRVIAAGDVRPQTMAALVAASGVRELHLCCPAPADGRPGPHRTEQAQVRAAVEAARALPLPDSPRPPHPTPRSPRGGALRTTGEQPPRPRHLVRVTLPAQWDPRPYDPFFDLT